MRTIILSAFVLVFVGCKPAWTKESLVKRCNKDFKERNELQKVFTEKQLVSLCDCVADKMIKQYKSEAQADKDQAGAEKIGRDCATDVMQQE